MPQTTVTGPLGELDLANHLRPHPRHAAGLAAARRIGERRRIGPAFLFPGPGYGGSCFPKDVQALIRTGRDRGAPLEVLEAVQFANDRQKRVLFHKLERHFENKLAGRTIAVWGLAFKAETDDVRESPALTLIELLLQAGAKVQVHDPAVRDRLTLYGLASVPAAFLRIRRQ